MSEVPDPDTKAGRMIGRTSLSEFIQKSNDERLLSLTGEQIAENVELRDQLRPPFLPVPYVQDMIPRPPSDDIPDPYTEAMIEGYGRLRRTQQ